MECSVKLKRRPKATFFEDNFVIKGDKESLQRLEHELRFLAWKSAFDWDDYPLLCRLYDVLPVNENHGRGEPPTNLYEEVE